MEQLVAIALSGGADSALAAEMLRDGGFRVFAVHALFGRTPRTFAQVEAARGVARHLGIEFTTVDLSSDFSRLVIEPFCREYARGRTPNPCVECNVFVKFGALLHAARQLGADQLATGHYARTRTTGGAVSLLRALDRPADQSYFLYRVGAEALSRTLLPLGELSRAEVRARVARSGHPVGRPSRDLCFVGGPGYGEFLEGRVHSLPGDIVDATGRVLGRHRGLAFYTVGQRHGLDLALGFPAYVTRLVPEENLVMVGPEDELYVTSARMSDLTWVAGSAPARAFRTEVRVRYRAEPTVADIEIEGVSARVTFARPQKGVAPGQSLVVYNGETVLGGGFLEAEQ